MWTSVPHLQKDLSPVAALISVMVTRAWCLSVPQPPQWLDTTQNSCGPSWPWLQTQAWSLSFLPCSGWRRARPLLSRREESAWQALGSAPYTRLFWGKSYPGGCLVVAAQCTWAGIEHTVLDQHWDGSQHEGEEQIQVDVVPGAVQLPEGGEDRQWCLIVI